jgi:hypothetical protein
VKANTGQAPEQALADAGYRSEDNCKALAGSGTELVVAMGREGKRSADVDAQKSPYTAAMAAKLQTDAGKAAYRKRKWIAEPPNGWIKSVQRVSAEKPTLTSAMVCGGTKTTVSAPGSSSNFSALPSSTLVLVTTRL